MLTTRFFLALSILISLSSTVAAEAVATAQPTNYVSALNDPVSAVEPSAFIPSTVSHQIIDKNNKSSPTTDTKPTFVRRSVSTISDIGSRSIQKVSALGSKFAVDANASQTNEVKDPFEDFNRSIFGFNMKFDKYVLLPVASTYNKIVPTPVRRGVNNFFNNLSTPWTAVNNLLQGHPGTSIESLSRFIINTVTTLGFYDTASYLGIERSDEDFGLTLGKWGVGSGPYVMLPLLGPSTVRDSFSRVVDHYGAPQTYINQSSATAGLTGVKLVDLRARLIGLESLVQGDQYTLFRDIYLQRRQGNKGAASATKTKPDVTMNGDFGSDSFGDEAADASGFDQGSVAPSSLDIVKTPSEESQQPTRLTISDVTADPATTADMVAPGSSVTATPSAPF